jgi:ankyrin repeat protein
VQLLIKHEASINLANKDGQTALHLALEEGHRDIVQLLIEQKSSIDLVILPLCICSSSKTHLSA